MFYEDTSVIWVIISFLIKNVSLKKFFLVYNKYISFSFTKQLLLVGSLELTILKRRDDRMYICI